MVIFFMTIDNMKTRLNNMLCFFRAGHTRVRATSLIEGQLRGPGFVSITRGDESTNIDIEGDGDNEDEDYGPSQFGESDLILPQPE